MLCQHNRGLGGEERWCLPTHPEVLRLPVHQRSQWVPRSHHIGAVILGTLLGYFGMWSQWERLP